MKELDEFIEANPHLKDFFPFLELLNKESHRGQVLISSSYLEEQLGQMLQAFFLKSPKAKKLVEGGYAPLQSFSARITTCFLLGLISEDERHDLDLIRDVRNEFAHKIHTTFETQCIASRCEQLKHQAFAEKDEVKMPAFAQFSTAATSLILHLVNRPHYVGKRRCEFQNWKY
ncbi:hypothetical protein [Elongatibacter sediminis]|uniref:Mannitol repressor n=1 Tax=Elongatibacter sediminis TaxID=3119006 RepID=A0AAW9RJ26_9GAMM